MPKKVVVVILVVVVVVVFFTPLKKHIFGFFGSDKKAQTEVRIIGSVSGFNPRVKEVQKILEDIGFETGSVDGRMGSQTRKAIMEFQKSKKLSPTGKIDSNTWMALNAEKEKIIEGILNPKPDPEPILESHPLANAEDEYKRGEEKAIQKAQIQDEIMGYRLKSKNRTKQVQTALRKAGFYRGEIDGKLGPQTKKAIKSFQKSKGLAPDGVVGIRTWEELSKLLKN